MNVYQIQQVLFANNNSSEWKLYFRRVTEELIQNSVSPFGSTFKYIDIVKDVVNLLPIYWISSEIVRQSPLRFTIFVNAYIFQVDINLGTNCGCSREHAMYDMFADVSK
jgi:hypothetical protein